MAEKKHQMNRRNFLAAAGPAIAGSGILSAGWPKLADAAPTSPSSVNQPLVPDPLRTSPVPIDLRGTSFSSFKTGEVQANGLKFSYVEVGDGPLALCLHGWPDSPYTYRYLLPILARAGFRAVAPYMRGFYPTEIPKGLTTTRDLAGDVAGLHGALGGDKDAVLIGHDWGAVAAYGGAAAEPDRWRRVAILNVPPLAVIGKVMFGYPSIQREFYWWFHQMEISNTVVPLNDFSYIDGIWSDWSPGYDAQEDLPYAKACLRPAGHVQATLGYYRTTFNHKTFASPEDLKEEGETWGRPLPQPCLYLHGDRDGLFPLTEQQLQTEVPPHLGPGSQVAMIHKVGHFMLVEDPVVVNAHILRFLTS